MEMPNLKKILTDFCIDEVQFDLMIQDNDEEFRSLIEKKLMLLKNTTSSSIEDGSVDKSEVSKLNCNVDEKPKVEEAMRTFSNGSSADKEQVKQESMVREIKNLPITFQNGKVNKEYCVDFDIDTLKLHDASITEVCFIGLEDIGLEYCSDDKKIRGTPIKAGDIPIKMRFKIKGYEDRPLLERPVVFIINPDPKSLWKDIPSEQDEAKFEYPKPDFDKLFIKGESKHRGKKEIVIKDIIAASQRGRSHANEGRPRDDDFVLHFDEKTKWYTIVVADGAGSAPCSRKGSQIACKTIVEVCNDEINAVKKELNNFKSREQINDLAIILQKIIASAVYKSYKAIEAEAQSKGRHIKEYATTLLLTICKKYKFGWFVGAWWVGDGGIGIYRKEPEYLKILGEPDGGDFAGQTRFLTMPEIIQNELYTRIRFDVIDDFTALILMTDGITDPKFETDANLNRIEKWHELWNDLNGNNEDRIKVDLTDDNEESAEQLLKWLDFWSKGNHDDRTIAILC